MTPQLILTQLPSKLENSPLYLGYYGLEDEGLSFLQKDLERAYSCVNKDTLIKRLISLETELKTQRSNKWPDVEPQSYDRLFRATAYAPCPSEAILWLIKMTQGMLQVSNKTDTRPLYLVIDSNTSGAFLVSTTIPPTRKTASVSNNPGLERLRRCVLERLREDL